VTENPYEPGEAIFPVAAFNSPGYVITRIIAYVETKKSQPLPLFSYGAVGWHKKGFRSAVVLVDPEPRQDLRIKKAFDRPLSWWIPSRVRISGVCHAKM